MASEDCTDSSLTSEPSNLTEIHHLSSLVTVHETRRTETGFIIRANRLPNCVPLPALKTPSRSWIWDHGVALGHINDQHEVLEHWLCKTCYDSDVRHLLPTYLLCTKKTTTKVIDHLESLHQFDRSGNKLQPEVSKKRKQGSLNDWARQQDAH
jgi:hypothetical protein